jgi:hypothetical protein
MIKYYIILYFLFFTGQIIEIKSQNFKISKTTREIPVDNQSIVYALPRTGITINIEMVRTSISKGPYAEYALKFLGISNAPMENAESWEIHTITISSFNEPDPAHYYSLNFKTFPANIQSLLSKDNNGVLFDLSGKWKQTFVITQETTDKVVFDPHFVEEIEKEHIDTLYKTILNDTTIVRVPVFKKQILAKTYEDIVKETAHELIKTRKHYLKYVRGEYEHHPDGASLRVMLDEMQKIENEYLELFIGKREIQRVTQSYTLIPDDNLAERNIGYFSKSKGLLKQQDEGALALSVQLIKDETATMPAVLPEKLSDKQILYYRIPAYFKVLVTANQIEKVQYRIPFYQFGTINYINTK